MRFIEFSQHTRKLRRNLLSSSVAALFVALFKIDTTQLQLWGIHPENSDYPIVKIILFLVVFYNLVYFLWNAKDELAEYNLKILSFHRDGCSLTNKSETNKIGKIIDKYAKSIPKDMKSDLEIARRAQECFESDLKRVKASEKIKVLWLETRLPAYLAIFSLVLLLKDIYLTVFI